MRRRTKGVYGTVLFLLLMVLLVSACGGTRDPSAPGEEGVNAPTGLDGKVLLEERCTRCHDLGRVEKASMNRDGWQANVDRMVDKGANLTAEEQEVLIDYLAATYGQ
jgi:hypothetical protein